MAKRVKALKVEIIIDPVGSDYDIVECCYELDDDTLSGVVYTNLSGPNPIGGRAITSGELSGTLQTFLDSLVTDVETQEGI